MSVTMILTGLMLPALIQVRENAHRVICSSNLRQIGLATVLWADTNNGRLPPSDYGQASGGFKSEMMAVHRGGNEGAWEGLGWLHALEYFKGPQVLYCPSHLGDHTFQRYENQYLRPNKMKIYSNYHYAGPVDWTGTVPIARRLGRGGERLVIATDGLRSVRDFNHQDGMNVLRGDNSVRWLDDSAGQVKKMLPGHLLEDPDKDQQLYTDIWELIISGGK